MGFPVYDYRTDVRNVLVTPQIRARFLRMEPGQSAPLHSHDLGHEVFLVLEGRAAFEIDGETQELGPGQMCVALADQVHSVRVIGSEPMTMYLSVTPHMQPTHTMRTAAGGTAAQQWSGRPPRFVPAGAYDEEFDPALSTQELLDRLDAAAEALAQAAVAGACVHQEMFGTLAQALAGGDPDSASRARQTMWEALFRTFQTVADLAAAWNDLAARTAEIA